MKKNILIAILIGVVFLLFFGSCKTTKNTFGYRQWHNMNARYNGYFLAGEAQKEVIKKIEKEYRFNYHELLPVFIYPTRETVAGYAGDFDKIIERSTGVIERHAIVTEKGKVEIANACKWIDENYTIIGVADLYKLELLPALEVFEYVSKKYPDAEAKYSGLIWMMKTYNRLGAYTKTEVILDEIKNAEDFPKDKSYARELALITTDYRIKRRDYPEAIEALKEAIGLTKKKKARARYTYLLAQLYAATGQPGEAVLAFNKVVKLHPPYEMVFNAKMSIATNYPTEQGNGAEIKRELIRMSKDGKNTEYLDQVYYALAIVSQKENDIQAALSYLEESIDNSINNNSQKALSYLKRGDIYLDRENYIGAEESYDSALAFLPSDHPDIERVQDKKKSLTDLVINLNQIALQDSLQTLAKMTEKERRKAISKMIKNKKEEEERLLAERQRKEQLKQSFANNQKSQPTLAQFGGAKAWYFYNDATVQLGITDFNKKWGNRRLEDDWRRSQKQSGFVSDTYSDEELFDTSSVSKNKNDDALDAEDQELENYLKTVPESAAQLEESTLKMMDAYYNAGVIYKEQLKNNEKSIQMFEEMIKRFPENKYTLTVYYQLYRTNLAVNNTERANYYKNILLENYPDTEYAKIIRSPDYAKNLMASKSEIEDLYEQTFDYYKTGNYKAAIANCKKAEDSYANNYLMPQFDLLQAMAIGRTEGKKEFENALTKVIIKHPIGPIKDKAQQLLELTQAQNKPKVDTLSKTPVIDSLETQSFYWVVEVDTTKGDIKKLEERIALLTTTVYLKDGLLVRIEPLSGSNKILTVNSLKGLSKAREYHKFIEDKPHIFAGIPNDAFRVFLISKENYLLLLKDKDTKKYFQIFSDKLK